MRDDRDIVSDMILRVLKNEDYYFSKFIDTFEDLSEIHQNGLLKYIVDEIGSDEWEKKFDAGETRELLLDILFYFSGSKHIGSEPDKDELRRLIAQYMRERISRHKKSFSESLKDLSEA